MIRTVLTMSMVTTWSLVAAPLSEMNCEGSYEDKFEYTVNALVVTGGSLQGGVAEVTRSTPQVRIPLTGHYLHIAIAADGGPTYYSGKGFSLTIPGIQSTDLPYGQRRGTLQLSRRIFTGKIPVRCTDSEK